MNRRRVLTEAELRRFHRFLWVPFWFTAFLSAVAVLTPMLTATASAGMPVLACFLPMSFFFVALAQRGMSARIGELEQALGRSSQSGAD